MICQLVQRVARSELEPGNTHVLLTALAGVAAANIGGSTLHSTFGLSIRPPNGAQTANPYSRDMHGRLERQWRHVQLLVIDELSMVPAHVFWEVNRRLNHVLNTPEGHFGGLPVILFGDFYQLPPVAGLPVYEQRRSDENANKQRAHVPFLYDGTGQHLFSLFTVVFLKRQMRQAGDRRFRRLLNRLRIGKPSEGDIRLLETRSIATNPPLAHLYHNSQELLTAVHLFPTNEQADKHNVQMTARQARTTGQPIWEIVPVDQQRRRDPDGDAGAGIEGILPERLQVTLGMLLMLRVNLDVSSGLVNGALGELIEIEWLDQLPTISTDANSNANANDPTEHVVRLAPEQMPAILWIYFPAIRSTSALRSKQINGRLVYGIAPEKMPCSDGNGCPVKRTQFPLIPAYGLTIHKAQGMTLSNVVVDLGGKVPPAAAYVALSRAKSLDGIFLLNFRANAIKASEKVIQLYQQLRHGERPHLAPPRPITTRSADSGAAAPTLTLPPTAEAALSSSSSLRGVSDAPCSVPPAPLLPGDSASALIAPSQSLPSPPSPPTAPDSAPLSFSGSPSWAPIGLPNIGNSCYLNSIIQALLSLPLSLHQQLSIASQQRRWRHGTPRTLALVHLLDGLRNAASSPPSNLGGHLASCYTDLAPLCNSYSNVGVQQDAAEYWRTIFATLPPSADVIRRWSTSIVWQRITCSECSETVTRTVPDECTTWPLSLSNGTVLTTLPQLLLQALSDSAARRCCRGEADVQATTELAISEPAPILIFTINRWRGEFGAERNNARVLAPNTLSLPLSSPSFDSLGNASYRLASLIFHIGERPTSGHYIAVVSRSDGWWLCNDTYVCRVSAAQISTPPEYGSGDLFCLLIFVYQQ